jgi:plastocyanin
MRRRSVMLAAFVVVCAGGLAACGGDDGGGPTKAATDGKITVRARDISFDVGTIEAQAGSLEVTLVQEGALEHTFKIEDNDLELKVTGSVERDSGSWDLDPGDYEFECTVPGHAAQGMKGTVVVE